MAQASVVSERQREAGQFLLVGVTLLSAAAAAIHFAVLGEHFQEYWVFGVFFAVVAWAQLFSAGLLLSRPSRPVLTGMAVGNGIVVAVWIVTRTLGIPIGPEAGEVEAATFIDILSTAFEVLIVAGSLALLRRRASPWSLRPGREAVTALFAALVVAVLTTAALVSASGEGGHGGVHGVEEAGGARVLTVQLSEVGTLQTFLDPPEPGASEAHLTFFDASGQELAIASATLEVIAPGAPPRQAELRRFSPGHFVASVDLQPGRSVFHMTATTRDDIPLEAEFEQEIGS